MESSELAHLAKFSSRQELDAFLTDIFRFREDGLPSSKIKHWNGVLQVSEGQLDKIVKALQGLIEEALYLDLSEEGIISLFPPTFRKDLSGLLSKLIVAHAKEWTGAVERSAVAPPKLIDFDWRIDVKSSSNLLSRMQVPAVMVQMKVQDAPHQRAIFPKTHNVQFELDRETLQTMLDGLQKIRDQLASVVR